MKTVKSDSIAPPVLVLLYFEGYLTLKTDDCSVLIGYVFLQKKPDEIIYQCVYWSWSLTKFEQHYDKTQHKSLEIEWSVLLLRLYFEKSCFMIKIDHGTLKEILNPTDSTVRLTRWRIRHSKFDFGVVHRAGIENLVADALSRLKATGKIKCSLEDGL